MRNPGLNAAHDVPRILVFRNEAVRAEIFGESRQLVSRTAGEQNHRDIGLNEPVCTGGEIGIARKPRHTQVQKHDVRIEFADRQRQCDERRPHIHRDALGLEKCLQTFRQLRLVIDDQNASATIGADLCDAHRALTRPMICSSVAPEIGLIRYSSMPYLSFASL